MSLARRVQLAVLAHIRHVHTRYDQLLKETTWQNARKVVEQLCLDTLVQWRGDEETGRDQLDEILREVVVISDSETGESEDESTEETSAEEAELEPGVPGLSVAGPPAGPHTLNALQPGVIAPRTKDMPLPMIDIHSQRPKSQRRNQRGFKRYRAWEEAIRRNRDRETQGYSTAMETDSAPYSTYPEQIPVHSVAPEQTSQGQPFVGSNGSRPATPPSQDTPIPSIEPISPPTMPPSFIRTLPPRVALDIPQAETWNQHHHYQANPPVRTNPSFMATSGSNLQHPLGAPPHHHPINLYPVQYNQEEYHPHRSRQVYEAHPPGPNMAFQPDPWPPQGTPTARRIIMDVNRPGERSNPIVMEDRGGFYERVTQPDDHRVVALEPPILVREVRRWSRPPEHHAPPRQYVSRRESPPMAQEYEMEGVEVYHLARDPHV
ncbi:hypothetical protein NQ176_g10668 [Zarea fungicola]|uniref:Uncharacterized protein n=1 Tax=Zarea fungicola TaxID=93591 RepID=A0ACC1MFM7_9HYPO|nr:hypothetical protein NQ176_g10668 [Lecanicillium fungicola]